MDLINLKGYEGKGNKELAFSSQKLEEIVEDMKRNKNYLCENNLIRTYYR
jgi:hypothetical protein